MTETEKYLTLLDIETAYQRIKEVVKQTPFAINQNLSEKYGCKVWLKREDLQVVRSYKLRGAFNKINSLNPEEKAKGVVCASAGNHAQGVAYACRYLGIQGKIYMPTTSPSQKIRQATMFGKENIEIVLQGDTYDDAYKAAIEYCTNNQKIFIHPFDDVEVMAGQGTVAIELLRESNNPIDYIFVPIGGGGLISGLGSYFKQISPKTKIIGVEPAGAAGMYEALKQNKVVELANIEKFVDGAAVQKVGQKCFEICKNVVDDIILVPEGKVCTTILKLYNEEAIVVEPAGALSISALDFYQDKIKGKNIVCIISGGNNDITRTEEIKERSLLYEGLKHYFIVRFPQRAGALRDFLVNVLGPTDDISHFEYTKKNNREQGPALVGIELKNKSDYKPLIKRMEEHNFSYKTITNNPDLFNLLI